MKSCGRIVAAVVIIIACSSLIAPNDLITKLQQIQRNVEVAECSAKPHTSTSQDEMLYCLHEVLYDYLPIGYGHRRSAQLAVFAHHYDAKNLDKWNQDIRLKPLPQLEQQGCTVWEVGAHTGAGDSHQLLKKYPNCTFHAYEPVPPFFAQLEKRLTSEPRIVAHNYGIAANNSSFLVSESAIKGQATFIAESSGGSIEAYVKSFDFAVEEAGGQKPTLLHINCEGCEWEMIPEAVKTGFVEDIPVIQIGTHNYGSVGVGGRAWELCEMRAMLNKTHVMVNGVPFGWERWVIR